MSTRTTTDDAVVRPQQWRSGAGAWLRRHPGLVDAAGAALAAPPLAAWSVDHVGEPWVAVPAAVLVGALALRRSRPFACLVLVAVAALAHLVGGHDLLPADLAVLVAVYSAAVHGTPRTRRLALALGLAGGAVQGLVALPWLIPISLSTVSVVGGLLLAAAEPAVLAVAAWLAGQWRRTRLAYVASLVDRARRAEHEREQQAAIAAAAERARIARDVHDVVTHSLAVMIAQADGGRYAAATSPQRAVGALETIATTGRSALADMQRLLGVLRADDGDAEAVLTPPPDVTGVPGLVAAVRAGGLPVELRTTGAAQPLTPAAGLAAYRVVQEALTNVLKHGGPAVRARVVLAWSPAALRVCVEDDGRHAGVPDTDIDTGGGGHGLAGMRERVAAAGGSVVAQPRAGGGFAVAATVPVTAAAGGPGTPPGAAAR